MMTSARPIAISRSRVQTRISLRNECPTEVGSGVAPEVTVGAEDSGTVVAEGCRSSVLCILSLPRIYNMGIARDARCCLAERRFGQRRVLAKGPGRVVVLVTLVIGRTSTLGRCLLDVQTQRLRRPKHSSGKPATRPPRF